MDLSQDTINATEGKTVWVEYDGCDHWIEMTELQYAAIFAHYKGETACQLGGPCGCCSEGHKFTLTSYDHTRKLLSLSDKEILAYLKQEEVFQEEVATNAAAHKKLLEDGGLKIPDSLPSSTADKGRLYNSGL